MRDQTSFTFTKDKLTQSLLLRGKMEQREAQLDRETFSCSICLDLLKDPVTTPCGHSYCMNCIKAHWDGEDGKRTYGCPQCRKTFSPRPDLQKNIMLTVVVEELKKTGLQAAAADHCYAGAEDVACDVCTGRKMKAVKSCLVCLASYCGHHLLPHHTSSAFETHKLVNPSKGLKQNICSHHNEVMKIFCRTDQQCICYLCTMDEHKGHETVSVQVERINLQKDVKESLQKVQQRIQTREEEVGVLEQEAEAIKESADKAVKDSETVITELVSFIKEKGSDLKQQIKAQKTTEVSRAKELQKTLQQEITDLKRKDVELKQLLHTDDHIEFLLSYSQQSKLSESTASPRIKTGQKKYFGDVQPVVSEARDKLKEVVSEEWRKISVTLRSVEVLLPRAEPANRDELLKYSRQLTLDPGTTHRSVILSNQDRTVTDGRKEQRIQSQGRYNINQQVLSKETVTGPCYWEVEWTGRGISVAVVCKNEGTLDQSGFGDKANSWAIHCYKKSYEFRHNNVTTPLSGPWSSTVGVFVDPKAGVLSFYSVSDTATLLLRVQTTFTQPLHAGIWVWTSYFGGTTATIK